MHTVAKAFAWALNVYNPREILQSTLKLAFINPLLFFISCIIPSYTSYFWTTLYNSICYPEFNSAVCYNSVPDSFSYRFLSLSNFNDWMSPTQTWWSGVWRICLIRLYDRFFSRRPSGYLFISSLLEIRFHQLHVSQSYVKISWVFVCISIRLSESGFFKSLFVFIFLRCLSNRRMFRWGKVQFAEHLRSQFVSQSVCIYFCLFVCMPWKKLGCAPVICINFGSKIWNVLCKNGHF